MVVGVVRRGVDVVRWGGAEWRGASAVDASDG